MKISNTKTGISLIVLVITVIVLYYETLKANIISESLLKNNYA